MRDTIYSIRHPDMMLFDLDSTLPNTYGAQEGGSLQLPLPAHGYHPALVDGLTGDLGLPAAELYEACEENDCKDAIRLKENGILRELASEEDMALYRATAGNATDYAVTYGEFDYQGRQTPGPTLEESSSHRETRRTRSSTCIPSLSPPWRWSHTR